MSYRILVCGLAGVLTAGVASAQPLPRELTLSHAIRLALDRRAEVDAARTRIAAAEGAVRQADVGPNPTVTFLTENWRFYGSPSFSWRNDFEIYAYITQLVETGNKRERRTSLAQSEARIADVEREHTEWTIRQAVKRAYWRALGAQERAQLLRRSLTAASDLAHYHEIRWREGAASEADWIRVRLEEDRAGVTLTAASMEAEQALYELLR